MEKIQKLSYELHDLLLSSTEYLKLKECEVIMINNVEAKKLIDNYKEIIEKYNFDKSDEVLNALSNAKSLMFQNKLIIDYKKAYKDYQILVGNITDVVFKDFKKDSLLDKIIRAK